MDIDRMIHMLKHRDKVIPIGKFKGRFIEETNTNYLLWYVVTLKEKLEPALQRNIYIHLIDNYKFEFGKYRDMTISQIMMKDKGEDYLRWVKSNVNHSYLPTLIAKALD
jgi:uncharacterized protein (DUF3820 family)